MSFEESIQFLASLHYPEVPASTARRLTLEVGQELRRQQEHTVAESWQKTEPPAMESAEAPLRLYISMDGTSVHLTRGWSEMRLAAIYETEEVRQKDGPIVPRTVRPTYLPFRGDVDDLRGSGAPRAGRSRGGDHLGGWSGVDLAAGPETIPKRSAWSTGGTRRNTSGTLPRRSSAVEKVLAALQEALPAEGEARQVVQEQITYFTNQRHRMRYDEHRACGYQIGSGTVESACNRVIGQRLKQGGMIWSEEQAVAVATIRAALLDERWDDFWRQRAFTPRRHHAKAA
ncbi:MAG: hypothetical protein ACP5NB_06660 [Chloroflexia bacterium]